MLVNKKSDMTPYNMNRKPAKQYPFLMPLIWGGAWLMTRQFNLKIDKSGMKGIRPPYLVIATHQGFSDYYIAPLSMFPHRAMYVSDMEGFAGFGNWLYRGLGCIPKRRYVPCISVIKNIRYGLSLGQSVFIYPESRHSNVGTTAYIPKNIGRFAKKMNVPVVTLSVQGSYLANPFWDENNTRRVPMKAKMECVCSKEELDTVSGMELQRRIEEKLSYDEYRYQQQNNIKINNRKRAEGIHKALYQCIACNNSMGMSSGNEVLSCTKCGSRWELSVDGWLVKQGDNGSEAGRYHIPDWYEWQRSNVINEIEQNMDFRKEYSVNVKALPNEYGFVDMGVGRLTMDSKEFVLSVGNDIFHFPHVVRESVQTEYDYRGNGMCIVLSTSDCCYYIYSDDTDFQPTWFQFAGEYLFQKAGQ